MLALVADSESISPDVGRGADVKLPTVDVLTDGRLTVEDTIEVEDRMPVVTKGLKSCLVDEATGGLGDVEVESAAIEGIITSSVVSFTGDTVLVEKVKPDIGCVDMSGLKADVEVNVSETTVESLAYSVRVTLIVAGIDNDDKEIDDVCRPVIVDFDSAVASAIVLWLSSVENVPGNTGNVDAGTVELVDVTLESVYVATDGTLDRDVVVFVRIHGPGVVREVVREVVLLDTVDTLLTVDDSLLTVEY